MESTEAFISQAQSLANTADETGRKRILDTLRDVQYSLETPYDTLQRLFFLVNMFPFRLPVQESMLNSSHEHIVD